MEIVNQVGGGRGFWDAPNCLCYFSTLLSSQRAQRPCANNNTLKTQRVGFVPRATGTTCLLPYKTHSACRNFGETSWLNNGSCCTFSRQSRCCEYI